jgi:hypothetical protein
MESGLLKLKIPKLREARLAAFREHTAELPFFERYQAGDREGAWAGLQALGLRVREDPYAADALAVSFETMARVRANVETIAQRLIQMEYRFFHNTNPVAKPVLHPPAEFALSQVLRMEEEAGPLPLSIRAWFQIGGEVDLTGVHPRLSFIRGQTSERTALEWDLVFSDPLVIYGVESALKCVEHMGVVCFSDCASVKADSHDGGDPYTLLLESAGADCLIHGYSPEDITFVQYLRKAFEFGGFPGFALPKWTPHRPSELDVLGNGLLPI